MAPYDYRLNVQGPIQSALKGIAFGTELSEIKAAQQERELKRQQMEQAQIAAQEQQALLAQARKNFFSNPNPTLRDAAQFISLLPKEQQEGMKPFVEQIGQQEKLTREQAALNFGMQALTALETNPEQGVALLRERAEAEKNAGNEAQAQFYSQMAGLAEQSPAAAFKVGTALLANSPGGKDAIESVVKARGEQRAQELQPSKLKEAEATAEKAAVAAKFAESDAVMDLQKKGWDIKKLQSDIDISKQNARIAAANLQISREGNDLKRQELQLKLNEMVSKRDSEVRAKVSSAESARATIDNAVNTADRLLKNPAWRDVVGSFEGRMPEFASALDDKESDALALINTLGSQSFMAAVANVGSMAGLTEKEGEKLQNSVASLTRSQSEKQFEENLREFQRLMLKARSNLTTKYGVPESAPDRLGAKPAGVQPPQMPSGFRVIR